ncbi:MAG TPA: hypothetical protein P5022_18590, partial [Candidatus Paceibacterota bacterium]|nr:hypothetical protein [Candidatus Paceibacterota bacterium]
AGSRRSDWACCCSSGGSIIAAPLEDLFLMPKQSVNFRNTGLGGWARTAAGVVDAACLNTAGSRTASHL